MPDPPYTDTMSNKPYLEQPELHTRAEHRAALLNFPGNFREALRQAQEDPRKTLFGVAQGVPSAFITKVGYTNAGEILRGPKANIVHYRCTLRHGRTSSG